MKGWKKKWEEIGKRSSKKTNEKFEQRKRKEGKEIRLIAYQSFWLIQYQGCPYKTVVVLFKP